MTVNNSNSNNAVNNRSIEKEEFSSIYSNRMWSFWKRGMQSQDDRDAEFRARVASTAINAQKITDEYSSPEHLIFRTLQQPRTTDAPMYGVAHTDLLNTDAGPRSTFLAAQYYAKEDQKRRDELLAKVKEEAQAESA